ncbi:MAG: hypothetical protein HQK56_00855 [Deltaproteobacteria bacterium]|nr:hypothetical protein [Deltaproteobacteria bacterium]
MFHNIPKLFILHLQLNLVDLKLVEELHRILLRSDLVQFLPCYLDTLFGTAAQPDSIIGGINRCPIVLFRFCNPIAQFMKFGYKLFFSFIFIPHFRLLGRCD